MKQAALGLMFVLLTSSCARHHRAAMPAATGVFDTQVRNAVHMGDGDLEVQALRKRLLENPRDVQLRLRLAQRFEQVGYRDLALEHLRIAGELEPANVDLQLMLSKALEQAQLATQARQVLAALRTRLTTASDFSRAAILTDELGELADGEALHRKALELAPGNADITNNLAYNLTQQKKPGEAEALLRELLRNRPTHERARNNLARLYATALNQPEEALLHWKSVNGPAAAHNNLAVVYMEQERWADARGELEKALALRFQFPEALQNLHIVAAQTGGTVTLNLDRDRKPSGLSKFAKAFRSVFTVEEPEAGMPKPRRSRS